MGSRHLGELVLRPSSLRTLLGPQPSRIAALRPQFPSTCQRHIQTTPDNNTPLPQQSKTTTTDSSDFSIPTPSQSTSADVSTNLNLFFTKATGGTSPPSPSSADEVRTSYTTAYTTQQKQQQQQPKKTFGASWSPLKSHITSSGKLRTTAFLSDMHDPPPLPSPQSLSLSPHPLTLPAEAPIYPRLNASTGRSIELDPANGRDIVRGLGMLAGLMARNQVRSDFFKQRFHERPGLKRKRLKSERWRARFKKGFVETTGRVARLTRQGW